MRANIWAAALLVAVGFIGTASAAPILATRTSTTVGQATPSFFTSLSLPSFLTSTTKFSSFFPSMPSLANTTGFSAGPGIPLTNGQANAAYFQLFNMKAAPHIQ